MVTVCFERSSSRAGGWPALVAGTLIDEAAITGPLAWVETATAGGLFLLLGWLGPRCGFGISIHSRTVGLAHDDSLAVVISAHRRVRAVHSPAADEPRLIATSLQ